LAKKRNASRGNVNNNEGSDTSPKKPVTPRRGVGTSGIAFYQDIVNRLQPYELQWPQSMKTFEAMKNDDAIATVIKLTYNLIESAFANQKIKYNKNNPDSVKAARFLQWSLNTLDSNTYMQVIRNIETFKEKGFSIAEKVYRKVERGEWEGMYRVSDIANRPQLSLDKSTPFEIYAGGRRIIALRQDNQFFQNKTSNNFFISPTDLTGEGYKRIPRKKFMLFGENATDSTPFGNPLLKACYKAWKEKILLEDLEVNGASKDLAGIIELAIPSDILDKAASDPTSDEYYMVQSLISQAANIHNGDQSSIIRPSDLQEGSSTVPEYSTRLVGLEGGGRQFNPMEMIQKRRKAIFDIWGAGHTLTGEGSVSYNSAEVKNAIHMHYIKSDIKVIEDVLNKDLIPELINVMNDFNLSPEDMPRIVAGDIDKISYDEAGKLIQRGKSVKGIALTKENIIRMHEMMGFDTEHMEDLSQEELLEYLEMGDKGDSKSGEGLGSSGTGNSQQGGSNSATNTENA
tara:strand:+ start:29177 stop:30718 length:1542 start_codon:yes stop_codon:yes gene_type:complete